MKVGDVGPGSSLWTEDTAEQGGGDQPRAALSAGSLAHRQMSATSLPCWSSDGVRRRCRVSWGRCGPADRSCEGSAKPKFFLKRLHFGMEVLLLLCKIWCSIAHLDHRMSKINGPQMNYSGVSSYYIGKFQHCPTNRACSLRLHQYIILYKTFLSYDLPS
jgi:hypothetical protein